MINMVKRIGLEVALCSKEVTGRCAVLPKICWALKGQDVWRELQDDVINVPQIGKM